MKTPTVASASPAAWPGMAAAQGDSPSDTMVVTGLPPTRTCSATIVEGGAASEAAGFCGFAAFGIADGAFSGPSLPTTFPAVASAAVVLLEPLSEPVDPGWAPVFWPASASSRGPLDAAPSIDGPHGRGGRLCDRVQADATEPTQLGWQHAGPGTPGPSLIQTE